MNNLVKYFSVIILLLSISCSTNDNSLTKEDIEEIKGFGNLMTSIAERKPSDSKIFNTYFINELKLKIDLPDSAYIIKRDGSYHKGKIMDFPNIFEEIQGEMYEKDKYLICLSDQFIMSIVNISNKYNRLLDAMSDTEYINVCLNDYLKKEIKYMGVKESNGKSYISFTDDKENDYYFLSINDYAILFDINKKTDSEEIINFILKSIELF
jgi:hypothetical protein